MKLVAIILTLNEAQHLSRCLESLEGVANQVLVVDCGSNDNTILIAEDNGAHVVQHEWVNYATQFNWALTQLDEETEWVLRIDADEYLTPVLAKEIQESLAGLSPEVHGVFCERRMIFQGHLIRFGGVFRYKRGQCENRWMDEHISVAGSTVNFKGELIDDNLNSLTWWTDKHNHYSSREAVDLLNLEYGFMMRDSVASLVSGSQAGFKRWVKEEVYAKLPGGFRAFTYFFYRYALRLGFLDGEAGTAFHFLQGFWYRYLVDAKMAEVKRHMKENGEDIITAIDNVLGIDVITKHERSQKED